MLCAIIVAHAQSLSLMPDMSPTGGSFDDNVVVECTFPLGCDRGIYWVDGGELRAVNYTEPIVLERSCALSIAGVNAEGRIITDVVTRDFTITKVTPPWITVAPQEGIRKESFYVTKIYWHNVVNVDLDLSAYREDGSKYGEPVVWVTNTSGRIVTYNDYNGLWQDGLNAYKAYIYKNYKIEELGVYTLHIAGDIFVLDGVRYADELQFTYEVAAESQTPEFSPASGDYEAPLTVSISYPTDGSAFYPFYKIGTSKAKAYTGPFVLTESATVTAYGLDEDFMNQTPTATATYTLHEPTPAPDPLPTPDIQRVGNTITITSPTSGATIRYWLNDRMATAQTYSAPFEVAENGRVSCIAYTADRQSAVANLTIDGFVVDRGDKGDLLLLTPEGIEDIHVRALSPNGHYATGFSGSGEYSRGFIWDLHADRFWYPTPGYVNQFWDIDDDGNAYGWRLTTTDVSEQTGDESIMWGTCRDGVWTALSEPRPESDTIYSANREWAVIRQSIRMNMLTGVAEPLISMSAIYHNITNPEVITSIANDGTIFGTYDSSLTRSDKGVALVYTRDGRWRSAEAWLLDEKGYSVSGYRLTSVRAVSGSHDQLLLHAYPDGLSIDEGFTRGMLLALDVQVRHLAPGYVHAAQMQGSEIVKVEWAAPLMGAEDLVGYVLYRDDTPIYEAQSSELAYYDRTVVNNHTYRYHLVARYADGVTSAASDVSTVKVQLYSYLPIRNLRFREVGLNSMQLYWEAPVTTIPKLQYMDEEGEWEAFGSVYDSEWGIRIPASDMAVYGTEKIRTVQFMPTGQQLAYELRLYRANSSTGICEPQPFYTQEVNPESLVYNTLNTIQLAEPQSIPAGFDLVVSMWIASSADFNMFGVQYDGFRAGYTDLCRIDGAFDDFVVMSDIDPSTQIVLPLGVGICSDQQLAASLVQHYEVYADAATAPAYVGRENQTLIQHITEEAHDYKVFARYSDDELSEPVTLHVDFQNNTSAYVAVDSISICLQEHSASLSWQVPLDEDRTLLHWGDMNPAPGIQVPEGLSYLTAAAIYPATLTTDYHEDYEIIGAYFYPTADIAYGVGLDNSEGIELSDYQMLEHVHVNAMNYVFYAEPIPVNRSMLYQLKVDMYFPEGGSAPMAFDSSNRCQDGYSNIVYVGTQMATLSELVQVGEYPNWLMGLIMRRVDAEPMPLMGYNVYLNGARANADLLTLPEFATGTIADGRYAAQVEVVYTDQRRVMGEPNYFFLNVPEAIEQVTDTAGNSADCYDLLGRRWQVVPVEHGVYIQGNQLKIK